MRGAPPHAEAQAVATEHHRGPIYRLSLEGWGYLLHAMRVIECSSFGIHHIAQIGQLLHRVGVCSWLPDGHLLSVVDSPHPDKLFDDLSAQVK